MAGIDTLMVTDMITARPNEPVADVARRMSINRVGAVLVVAGGRLEGLFSERDLLTRIVAQNRNPQEITVGAVATRDVVTIGIDEPVKNVLAIFRKERFRHLPVVRGEEPVGILSTRDFLDYLVGGLERYINDLKYKRELTEGIDPYDHLGGSYAR